MNKFEKVFITGCDSKTEWMLPWFAKNYYTIGNSVPLVFANFGTKNDYKDLFDGVIDMTKTSQQGWFNKVNSLVEINAHKCIWLDTDCEVKGNLTEMFDLLEERKLNMVVDRPWKKRKGGIQYNTGVVGIIDKPPLLEKWLYEIRSKPLRGDQETLMNIIQDPLDELVHVAELHNKYNYLRLQFEHDNEKIPNDVKIIHWTGKIGKERIRNECSTRNR